MCGNVAKYMTFSVVVKWLTVYASIQHHFFNMHAIADYCNSFMTQFSSLPSLTHYPPLPCSYLLALLPSSSSSSSPIPSPPSCSSSSLTPLPNYLPPLLPPLHTTTLPCSKIRAFCVLSSVVEQLKVEGIVDLFFCSSQAWSTCTMVRQNILNVIKCRVEQGHG